MERKVDYEALKTVIRGMNKNAVFSFFKEACKNGCFDICEACLEAGVDVNIRNDNGNTLLMSRDLSFEMVKWLISKGAKVNIYNCNDFSPLLTACIRGDLKLSRFFIKNGAKIRELDLYFSISSNYEIIKLLLDNGAIVSKRILKAVVMGGKVNLLELFLKYGVSANGFDDFEEKPICIATKITNEEMVRFLLNHNANPNVYFRGETPLHIAVRARNKNLVRLLLENNADVNAMLRDEALCKENYDFSLTAMDMATFMKDEEMKNLLACFGGKISKEEERVKVRSRFS